MLVKLMNFCLSLIFAFTLGNGVYGQNSVYGEYLAVSCFKEIDGVGTHVVVKIDLKRPDIGDDIGWGIARRYEVAESTKENCHGMRYAYGVVEMDPAWTQEQELVAGSGQGERTVFALIGKHGKQKFRFSCGEPVLQHELDFGIANQLTHTGWLTWDQGEIRMQAFAQNPFFEAQIA